jgi:hypothetical protein
MSIEFRCPNCGALLRVPDDTAGHQAQCPECQHVSTVAADSNTASLTSRDEPAADTSGDTEYAMREEEAETEPGSGEGAPPPPPPPPPPGAAGPGPYGPEAAQGDWAASQVRSTAERLSVPAVTLMVLAGIDILMRLLGLLSNAAQLGMGAMMGKHGPEAMVAMFSGTVGIITQIVLMAVSAAIIYGAVNMMNVQNYEFSVAAAVLALIPCVSPCCCVSIPFGIWSLIVLLDDPVRDAFRWNSQAPRY